VSYLVIVSFAVYFSKALEGKHLSKGLTWLTKKTILKTILKFKLTDPSLWVMPYSFS